MDITHTIRQLPGDMYLVTVETTDAALCQRVASIDAAQAVIDELTAMLAHAAGEDDN